MQLSCTVWFWYLFRFSFDKLRYILNIANAMRSGYWFFDLFVQHVFSNGYSIDSKCWSLCIYLQKSMACCCKLQRIQKNEHFCKESWISNVLARSVGIDTAVQFLVCLLWVNKRTFTCCPLALFALSVCVFLLLVLYIWNEKKNNSEV